MGAAGNKKPKKSKRGKHAPKYMEEDTSSQNMFAKKKK